jgi:hypothetical protein
LRRTRRVRGIGAIPAVFVRFGTVSALAAMLAASGCGGGVSAPPGGGYGGLTADARITAENAAPLTALALGLGTGLDAFLGRATAGAAKAGDASGLPALPASVPSPVRSPVWSKDLRMTPSGENGDVLAFDYLVPGPSGGQVRVYGTLWPNGTGALVTAFEEYGRGDGFVLGGTVSYLIVARDPGTGRITAMDIRLARFAMTDAVSDLRLDGGIAVTSPAPGQAVNRLDIDGRDRATGREFRYRDFVLVRATAPGAAPTEDVDGNAFEGDAGRLTVATDSPLTYAAGLPAGGGPVRLAGAAGTGARVTPLGDGTAEIAVDGDGDGTFEAVRVLAWDLVR